MSSLYDDSDSNEERIAFQNGGGESWKVQHMYSMMYTRSLTAGSDFTGSPASISKAANAKSVTDREYSLLAFSTF